MKQKKIKGYMTFRGDEPLLSPAMFDEKYYIYLSKAPIWQDGDKSVPVVINYNSKR